MLKRQNGITMVSLVITIIVLLIISVLVIANTVGVEKLGGQADKSKESFQVKQDREAIEVMKQIVAQDHNGVIDKEALKSQVTRINEETGKHEHFIAIEDAEIPEKDKELVQKLEANLEEDEFIVKCTEYMHGDHYYVVKADDDAESVLLGSLVDTPIITLGNHTQTPNGYVFPANVKCDNGIRAITLPGGEVVTDFTKLKDVEIKKNDDGKVTELTFNIEVDKEGIYEVKATSDENVESKATKTIGDTPLEIVRVIKVSENAEPQYVKLGSAEDTWTNQPITVKVLNASQFTKIKVEKLNGELIQGYKEGDTFTYAGNYKITAQDGVQKEISGKVTKYDNLAPSDIKLSTPERYLKTDGFSIKVDAKDQNATDISGKSGIAYIEYKVKQDSQIIAQGQCLELDLIDISNGIEQGKTYTYSIYARDRAGNEYETQEKQIKILTIYEIKYMGNGGRTEDNKEEVSEYKKENTNTEIRENMFLKPGYSFTSWNTEEDGKGKKYIPHDSFYVDSHLNVYAIWEANKDTRYRVIHEKERLDGEYEIAEIKTYFGTTDETVIPPLNTYQGFTPLDDPKPLTITGDGQAEITYKYYRNEYTVSAEEEIQDLNKNVAQVTTITGTGKYKFEKSVTLNVTTRPGYDIIALKEGDQTLAETDNLKIQIAEDKRSAQIKFDMPARDVNLIIVVKPAEIILDGQTISKEYSTEAQTANVVPARKGTGSYTYQKVSGESDITVSAEGVITIPAEKPINTAGYVIRIKATDAETEKTSEANYTIKITKALLKTNVVMEGYTYGDTPSTPSITYNPESAGVTYYYNTINSNTEGTKWENIEGTTLDAGTYYMYAITEETANYSETTTAAVEFVVSKATLNTSVNMESYTYGETPSTPSITNNPENGVVTYYYNTINSNEGGTEWKNIGPRTLNAGTYYMYAIVESTKNYNRTTTATKAFEVEKTTLGKPEVSIDNNGNVTWTEVEGATGYEISYDGINYEPAVPGSENIIVETESQTPNTGEKEVKVRAVSTNPNYESPSEPSSAKATIVALILNKGTGISAVTGGGRYIAGKTVNINATVSEGYSWKKWVNKLTNDDFSIVKQEAVTVNSNMILEAEAEGNPYKVRFNSNGGTGSMADQDFVYGVPQVLSKNTFEYEGKEFYKWNTLQNPTEAVPGTSYQDEEEVSNLATTGVVNLYAEWKPAIYAKYYNDGTLAFSYKNDIMQGKTLSDLVEDYGNIYEDNYETDNEVRWKNERAGITKAVITSKIIPKSTARWFSSLSNLETILNLRENMDTSEVTNMTAMFNGCSKLVELDLGGFDMSKVTSAGTMLQNVNSIEDLCTPAVYPLKANIASIGLPRTLYDTSLTPYTNIGQDISPVHTWIRIAYEVEFKGNGGKTEENELTYYQKVLKGMSTQLLENKFENTNFTFNKWNTVANPTESNPGTVYEDKQAVLNPLGLKLYAQWKPGEYTIKFDKNNENAVGAMAKQKVEYNATVNLLENVFELEGYGFTYWTLNADGTGTRYEDKAEVTSLTNINQEITLYANYKPTIYVKLYSDGTLGFSHKKDLMAGKSDAELVQDYGDIWGETWNGVAQSRWNNELSLITKAVITDKIYPNSTAYWFCNCTNLTRIDGFEYMDSSNTTTMRRMFYGCRTLREIELSSFNTENVTNMYGMFDNCSGLKMLDLSSFNMQNVTDTETMLDRLTGLFYLVTPNKYPASAVMTLTRQMYERNEETGNLIPYNNIKQGDPEQTLIQVKYIIKYNGNGGTPRIENGESLTLQDDLVLVDEYATIKENIFEKEGHRFIRWDTMTDGSGYSGVSEGEFNGTENQRTKFVIDVADQVITLYAVWVENIYNIEFDPNGATSGTMGRIENVKYSQVVSLLENQYANTGYDFAGWTKSPVTSEILVAEDAYHYSNSVSSDTNWVSMKIAAPFYAGDVYRLEYDIKGNGTVKNFFYKGTSSENIIGSWERVSSAGETASGSREDGYNSVTLTSSFMHYTTTFNINKDSGETHSILFQLVGGSQAEVANIRLYKIDYPRNDAFISEVIDDGAEYEGPIIQNGNRIINFEEKVVEAPFYSGDVYQLEYDVKGSGVMHNFFYGDDGYLGIEDWSRSDGVRKTDTRTDGYNVINLTSNYKHYTIKFVLGGSGDGNKNKKILFRTPVDTDTATVKNVKLYKVTSKNNQNYFVDNEKVSKLTATNEDTITLYAMWKPKQYTLTYEGIGGTARSDALLSYDGNYNSYSDGNYNSNSDGNMIHSETNTWSNLINASTYAASVHNTTWGATNLQFNGTNSYADLGKIYSDYQTLEITFAIFEQVTERQCLIGNWYENTGGGIYIDPVLGIVGQYGLTGDTNMTTIASRILPEANIKYHVVLTVYKNNIYLFANGKLLGRTYNSEGTNLKINQPTSTANEKSMVIGKYTSNRYYFKGNIYNVAIFNKWLQPAEAAKESGKTVMYKSNFGILPEPTQGGYVFNGWYTRPVNGYEVTENTSVDEGIKGDLQTDPNLTIFAHWQAGERTITVEHYLENANNNDYSKAKTIIHTVKSGTVVNIESMKTTLTNATYNHASNDSGTTISGNITVNSNIKIKMYYTRNRYTITLAKNDNIGAVAHVINEEEVQTTDPVQYKVGQNVKIKAYRVNADPGYTITWQKWKSNSDKLPADKFEQTQEFKMPATNVKLTAYAIKQANKIVITYDPNGGTVSPKSVTRTYGSSPVTLPTPTHKTLAFDGWYTAKTGGTKVGNAGGSYAIPTRNTTLYAHWVVVAYVSSPGIDANGNSRNYGDTITKYETIDKSRSGATIYGYIKIPKDYSVEYERTIDGFMKTETTQIAHSTPGGTFYEARTTMYPEGVYVASSIGRRIEDNTVALSDYTSGQSFTKEGYFAFEVYTGKISLQIKNASGEYVKFKLVRVTDSDPTATCNILSISHGESTDGTINTGYITLKPGTVTTKTITYSGPDVTSTENSSHKNKGEHFELDVGGKVETITCGPGNLPDGYMVNGNEVWGVVSQDTYGTLYRYVGNLDGSSSMKKGKSVTVSFIPD